MIVTKTKEFHKKFLYDLGDLVMFKHEYLESILKWDKEGKLMDIGYGKQPSKTVKFFGSYFDKKPGSPVTDIDVILLVNNVKDDRFYLRLGDILKRLDRTRFKFVRFYCGYIKGLEPPWKVGDHGDCDFNVVKVDAWIAEVKKSNPSVYEKLKPYLDKKTVSMRDLILADQAIEPYISLTWTRDEIIRGYKVYNGVKYLFRDAMYSYNRYRVMKFMYEYEGKYCLVDLNFVTKDKSIPRTTKDALSYYTNDVYKKFKYLKKMIVPEMVNQFIDDRRTAIGHITPLAAFVEMTQRIKKYSAVDPSKLKQMEIYALKYAKDNNIRTVDYDGIQDLIVEKIKPLYEKYKNLIQDKFKIDIFTFSVRSFQLDEQITKKELEIRLTQGYDCTLFPINISHIEMIYKRALACMIDPYMLYACLHEAWSVTTVSFRDLIDSLFGESKFKIVAKDNGKYAVVVGDSEVAKSSKLKKLQRRVLFGLPKVSTE